MKKLLFGIGLVLSMSACHHGGDRIMEKRHKAANAFIDVVKNSTGEDYQVVKWYGKGNGDFIVFKNVSTGEYLAVNLAKFDKSTMTTLDQYLSNIDPDKDIVHNLEQFQKWEESGYYKPIFQTQCGTICVDVEIGSEWVNTSDWVTYYGKGDLVFDSKGVGTKDLELIASLAERAMNKTLALSIQSQFSLSLDRSQELSNMLIKYRKLDSIRELTDSEKSIFSLQATGASFKDIESALKQKSEGKDESYKKLLEKAAAVNGTTPEKIGEFFEAYILE